MADAALNVPTVPVLLLGDEQCGKSTFISRLMLGTHGTSTSSRHLPKLRDLDQPFGFDVRLYNRQYRFEFYDTASPTHYSLLKPEMIILCYSVAQPETLKNVVTHWKRMVEMHFNYDERLPVLLLGLMRDLRQKEDYDGNVKRSFRPDGTAETDPLNGRRVVYPQEGLKVAQEMRCDRYCECSALTGELCREVFEDITRTAALTTTEKGGKTEATYCSVM